MSKRKIFLGLAILLLCGREFGLRGDTPKDYSIKALMLKKFAYYADWPKTPDEQDKSKPFILGIMGDPPFFSYLDKYYKEKKEKIKDKNVEIRNISNVNEIQDCHFLFISEQMWKSLPDILAYTRSKPILTVGNTQGYAERGVLINFYSEEEKNLFEVNFRAVRESGLFMSSNLLKLARLVDY